MPAIGTGSGKTAKNEPKGVTRKPAPPTKSPAGDRAGATGIPAANTYKRTPAYRKAIRDTYKEQPVAARRVIARNVAKTAAPATKKRPIDRKAIAAYKALPKAQRASVDAALRRLTAARLGARSTATTISRVHEQRRATDLAQLNELGFLAREKYGYTPKVTKTNVMPEDSAAAAKKLGWTPAQYKANKDVLSRHPEKAGFKPEGRLGKAIALPALVIPGAAKSAGALAEATYHDPVGVPTKTAKQLALATAAVVPGLVKTAIHPVQTGKDIVDSMYESYAEPYDKKVAHIRKEGGLQDAINVASVLAPTSKALALGKFGPVERAGLRVSGGLVKARKPRSGLLSGLAGQAIDNAKARRYERLAEADKPLTGQQRAALNANRAAGRTVEVVPSRVKGKVIRDVAKLRGRAVNELHYDLSKGDFGQAAKKLGKLDKHEKKALWFSAAGVRTAQQAVDLLPALKQKILDARGDKAPKGRYKKMDMVARIDEILADPEKHFTQHLDEVMNDVAQHAEAISARDPRYAELTKEARRRADRNVLLNIEQGVLPSAFNGRRIIDEHGSVEAALKATHPDQGGSPEDFLDVQAARGVHQERVPPLRYADESDADFQARADNLAEARGLRKPMYFKAERHRGEQADHSAFAVGGGRAMAYEGQHQGRNLRKGVLDMSERAFLRGYARNVKAAHNWPLVANMIERHAYEDLTPGPGVDVGQALDAINQATPEIKPGDVSLINPGIFRKHLEQHVDETKGSEGLPEDLGAQNVLDAMSAATLEHGVQQIPAEFQKTNGWKAVPTSMLRELEAEMKAGTKGGRYLDIAKGKASRAILLTANVPWLAIQTVSEGGVTALATKGSALNPVNWLGTRSWWKGMTHEQRQEVSGVLGLNATSADLKQTRLGAVSSGGFVNAWRALKEAPVWHKDRKWLAGHGISELNPAEMMAAADRGKTNVTRLLLAHSELKKAAVADMAEGMAAHEKATTRLMHVFQQPVAKQYETLRENPHLLEDVGETLNKWLGDWTTMTAAERKVINRMVMFYPYVRYSTRLLFYTLPVEHPLVAATLAEIGQLTQEEYHEVFGDDDLPWNIGKVYFGKTGESKSIDLVRGNPLMNAATSALARIGTSSSNIPGAVVGSLPPYGQWMVDQLTGVNTFKGRPLRLHGDTDPFYNKPWEISLKDHAKLAVAQVQSLFYPGREAMARLHPGAQSDESSLLFPTPMKYKRSDQIEGNGEDAIIRRATAKNAETNDKFARENDGGLAGLVLGPLLPTPSRDAASSREREYVKKLKAKQAKGAAERKAYRDSHGGKNKPKPHAFGASGGGGKAYGARGGGKPFGTK